MCNPNGNARDSLELLLDVLKRNGLDRDHHETHVFAITLFGLIHAYARIAQQPMTDDEDSPPNPPPDFLAAREATPPPVIRHT